MLDLKNFQKIKFLKILAHHKERLMLKSQHLAFKEHKGTAPTLPVTTQTGLNIVQEVENTTQRTWTHLYVLT